MALQSINPTHTAAWKRLQDLHHDLQDVHMLSLFKQDANRAAQFSVSWEQFFLDYSKNRINQPVMQSLIALAHEVQLKDAIEKYFSGDKINQTEQRAVLHTALRKSKQEPFVLECKDITFDIQVVKEKMATFCDAIITGKKVGYTGLPFTDVVNVGIGGSDLGPAMATDALAYYSNHLKLHFVSNVDGDHVQQILKELNPATTLFVIVSKTFTTQETRANAQTIRKWFVDHAGQSAIATHFVAVSTNLQLVREFGISTEQIFPMWDWVGGRFSLWSAVGLSLALQIGYDHFEQVLLGAGAMDDHFRYAPFEANIPVVLALLSVWYNNFFGAETHAIIPYTQYLHRLPAYLQQGIMESNGKGVGRDGQPVNYQTGNIIWGEPGTNAQHAFFQLLHQGTKIIPADFIGFLAPLHGDWQHHDQLMANYFAQTEALLKGKSAAEVTSELTSAGLPAKEISNLIPFKTFTGNRPTNTLLIEQLTPYNFGALVAMYESKIYTEGVIWNIFSFDQWGVELGKQLANDILADFQREATSVHDASTHALINLYRQKRKS